MPAVRGQRRSTPRASGSRTRSSASGWWRARPAPGKIDVVFPSGARVLAAAKIASSLARPIAVAVPVADRPPKMSRDPQRVPRPRDELARAKLALPHAIARRCRGSPCGSGWRGRFEAGIPGSTEKRWLPRRASPTGALVLVADGDGRPLARGFWDAQLADRRARPRRRRPSSTSAPRSTGGIAAALARRLAAIDRRRPTAFRWIHGEADGLPGVHADVYGSALSFRYDGGGARAFYRELPGRLRAAARAAGLPSRGHRRAPAARRERRPKTSGARCRSSAALPEGELEIRENGLLFGADLRRGQKGGLFLDQRENRARVRALARERRVLNLFGYTGGFSVYAAAGGARETTTVDVAAPAIAAARRNFERNDLPVASGRASPPRTPSLPRPAPPRRASGSTW